MARSEYAKRLAPVVRKLLNGSKDPDKKRDARYFFRMMWFRDDMEETLYAMQDKICVVGYDKDKIARALHSFSHAFGYLYAYDMYGHECEGGFLPMYLKHVMRFLRCEPTAVNLIKEYLVRYNSDHRMYSRAKEFDEVTDPETIALAMNTTPTKSADNFTEFERVMPSWLSEYPTDFAEIRNMVNDVYLQRCMHATSPCELYEAQNMAIGTICEAIALEGDVNEDNATKKYTYAQCAIKRMEKFTDSSKLTPLRAVRNKAKKIARENDRLDSIVPPQKLAERIEDEGLMRILL